MSQCLNPDCLQQNTDTAKFCAKCGSKLLLAERYRALVILGKGGFGRTFKAIDEYKPSQPFCVIKQFLPQAQGTSSLAKASELFAQEAEGLEKLGKHSQIPTLMAYFTQDEYQYLVQEFIDGKNLAEELANKGIFNEQQIRQLLQDLLSVLQFVHENKIIHRDIKPENIIKRNIDGKFILVDFGAAKVVVNTSLSVVGTVIGSAEYTAPEQAMGKPKYGSDLYSLGVTCLYLLTQTSPFDLYDVEEGKWNWRNYLVNNPVSKQLGEILDKLIAPRIKQRYKSTTEVLANLTSGSINIPSSSSSNLTIAESKVLPKVIPPKLIQKPFELQQLKTFQFELIKITLKNNPSLWKRKTSIEYHRTIAQGKYLSLDLGNNITLDLVFIPGGKVLMGSSTKEKGHQSWESPQHWVTVSPFYLGKYPVTQAQWQVVMGNNPSYFKGRNRPVERVSWNDCVFFCEVLTKMTKLNCRLPSEAEWEYACRAGTFTPFHFGETITDKLANYKGISSYSGESKGLYRQQTTKVGSFPPNAFGLYDMHGNVWEWCADTWHNNYHGAPIDGSAWIDKNNYSHVLRGGSWVSNPRHCRSANRNDPDPDVLNYNWGMRVVFAAT